MPAGPHRVRRRRGGKAPVRRRVPGSARARLLLVGTAVAAGAVGSAVAAAQRVPRGMSMAETAPPEAFAPAGPVAPFSGATAFVGVDVRTMAEPGELLRDRVVLVRDGRIARIAPWRGRDGRAGDETGAGAGAGAGAGSREIPPDARMIRAEGRVLAPGLVDAHTHAGGAALPLYVAAGVTTVRLMHGDAERLTRRERQRTEDVPSPHLIVAGPLVAGEEVPWPHVLVTDTATARREVDRQADAGYDFLKVYDGLARPVYDALVERAAERGLPVAGHVPMDVGLGRVLETGQRTIEHAEQLLYAEFGRSGIMALPFERLDRVVSAFEAAGAAGTGIGAGDAPADLPCLTPTLRAMTLLMRRGTVYTDTLWEAGRMRWADPALAGWWESFRTPAPPEARQRRERFLALQQRLTRRLAETGVPILAGTDTPYPLLVPGFSLHEELAALEEAGLSREATLAAATRSPGRCLPSAVPFGTVSEGARADLLLLEDDPLGDPAVLRRPVGVMLEGRWYDRAALDALRREALPDDG